LRDLAFVVAREVAAEQMLQEMKQSGALFLANADVFDVYSGDRIAAGKKSVAFSLEFVSEERTLEQSEVDAQVDRIVKHLAKSFEATLRA
jgi:phenylalanyl-tRNA synthetase beta chain